MVFLSGVELVVHSLPPVQAKPGVHIQYILVLQHMSCTYTYQQVVSVLIEAITACLITLKQLTNDAYCMVRPSV